MKRARRKKQSDLQFTARLGDSSIQFRLRKPDRQAWLRFLKFILVLVLALLMLFAPEVWQAVQRALSFVHW